MFVEPRRNEHVELRCDNRERQKQRTEQRQLQLGEEKLLRCGVDQFDAGAPPGGLFVRVQQQIEDRLRDEETGDKSNAEPDHRLHQPGAQFRQMLD